MLILRDAAEISRRSLSVNRILCVTLPRHCHEQDSRIYSIFYFSLKKIIVRDFSVAVSSTLLHGNSWAYFKVLCDKIY